MNVGTLDRVIRILIGITLISFVFVGPQSLWGWVGLIPLLTGLFARCPAYSLFGWSSCKV